MGRLRTSPDRGSFQKEMFGDSVPDFPEPVFQKYDLEYDLRTTDWIVEKVQADASYAQNLYAALCNNWFIKNETWPILKDEYWDCSWRYAGGIIAHMLETGDYIDWYCSGISSPDDCGYTSEGVVTDEVRDDLLKLGWSVSENDDSES